MCCRGQGMSDRIRWQHYAEYRGNGNSHKDTELTECTEVSKGTAHSDKGVDEVLQHGAAVQEVLVEALAHCRKREGVILHYHTAQALQLVWPNTLVFVRIQAVKNVRGHYESQHSVP